MNLRIIITLVRGVLDLLFDKSKNTKLFLINKKLTAIVFDIAHNILFKPVAIKKNEIEHNKSAKSKIPLCVKDQAVNYKNVFQDVKSKHAE
jgi:hypothetical protein